MTTMNAQHRPAEKMPMQLRRENFLAPKPRWRWTATIFVATLGLASVAQGIPATSVDADGLVRLEVRQLDEFLVRPNADIQAYRKVIVEPARVEFRKGWLKSINATRGPSRWLVPEDAKIISDNAATSLGNAVAESFRARGFEVVTTPEAGVLRVSPRVADLVVNAPDVASASPQALFNVDAGEATLIMEIRDASTGQLLGRVVDRGTAHELSSRINRAFAVTNLFWFDALFRQWSANCVREFTSPTLRN